MADETILTFTFGVVSVSQKKKKSGKRWSWTPHLENSFCCEHAYSYLLRYAIA